MLIELLCRFHRDSDNKISESIEQQLDTEEIIQGSNFNREKYREKLLKKHNCF